MEGDAAATGATDPGALINAAEEGNAAAVNALLAAGAIDVNHAAADGWAALICAAQQGHTEVVCTLLAVGGIRVNHASIDGHTALMCASAQGHADIVRALLAVVGIDAHCANQRGDTALTLASMKGQTEIVHALLAVDGIDPNHTNNDGNTALIRASTSGHAEVVRTLLAVEGTDPNTIAADGFSALTIAITLNQPGCVRSLATSRGININLQSPTYDNQTALHMACAQQSAEMAERLLLAGGCRFRLDDSGMAPLECAQGSKGVVAVFAAGIDYWQRKRHGGHAWATKAAVTAVLLVRQRLDARAAPHLAGALPVRGRMLRSTAARARAVTPVPLPHLPEEIWLTVCCFLRSADFMP